MFRTWLIANLGIVYFACVLVLAGISALFLPTIGTEEDLSVWGKALVVICIISVPMIFGAEPTIGPIVSVLALAGLYVFLIHWMKDPEVVRDAEFAAKSIRLMNSVIIPLSIASLVPAVLIARYAYINFDDVVSRRWMYRNSGKDVFETTWKYTINRFFMGFLVTFSLLLDIAAVIFIRNASLQGGILKTLETII